VQGRVAEFERRGAQVIAVGQGTGAEAAAAARRHRITYPCLGVFEDLRGSWQNLRRADLAASRNPRSDVRRLGGALVIDRSGRVRFLHRSATTTDVPSTDALLAALDTA
jgi:hypothetical protein